MKFCRFQPLLVPAERIRRAGFEEHPQALRGVMEGEAVREIEGELFGAWKTTERAWPLAEVKLLPPVVPSKIVCLGRNYREHAAELGHEVPPEPLIFLKAPSAVIGPEEPIVLPAISRRVDHEGEIALVVGRMCSQLRAEAAVRPYLFGVTCLNDVTARDLQKTDVQFTRAKGFDTFCPLGPVLETEFDAAGMTVETRVNGERRQRGSAAEMIFSVDDIMHWVSRMMTLFPGDVIATGTPAGVGPLKSGDVVEVTVSGAGTLRNPVIAQTA